MVREDWASGTKFSDMATKKAPLASISTYRMFIFVFWLWLHHRDSLRLHCVVSTWLSIPFVRHWQTARQPITTAEASLTDDTDAKSVGGEASQANVFSLLCVTAMLLSSSFLYSSTWGVPSNTINLQHPRASYSKSGKAASMVGTPF